MVFVADYALLVFIFPLVFLLPLALVAVSMVPLVAEMVVDGDLRANNPLHGASGAI